MRLIIEPNYEQLSKWAANYVIERINAAKEQEKPFVLGLPTGSSPERMYAELIKAYKEGEFRGVYKNAQYNLATKTWDNHGSTENFKLDNINASTSGTLNTVIVKDGNTFLMVPQTLPSGAKIVITFADNSHITANIGGKTWKAGTTKTYMMTEKNSNWDYQIETTDPATIAYNQTTSTDNYTVQSYRKDPTTNTFQPVKWEVVSYQESTDGGKTWSAESPNKPSWLTNLSLTKGAGGKDAEVGKPTVTTAIVDSLDYRNQALKNAEEKGSNSNPYNLANKTGGEQVENTANCYVISAAGYYRIPLVYGNAIKNGQKNESAYKTTHTGPIFCRTSRTIMSNSSPALG